MYANIKDLTNKKLIGKLTAYEENISLHRTYESF